MSHKQKTKKKNKESRAYKLITDPTVLLKLLYSKYGDIKEDFGVMKINSLLYTKKSRIYIQYNECVVEGNTHEYFKRFYYRKEAENRIPKLSEYYKNYHLFFYPLNPQNISLILHSNYIYLI